MNRTARVTPVEQRKVSAPRLGRPYRIERSGLSPEAWPDAEPWGRLSLWQEPRWNADRRARFAKRALRRRVQQLTTRLSAFCFLVFFVCLFVRAVL